MKMHRPASGRRFWMDVANQEGALVVGTGDLSELALGWCTYNGDHMSMYAVNAGIPKTLVRYVIAAYAESHPKVKIFWTLCWRRRSVRSLSRRTSPVRLYRRPRASSGNTIFMILRCTILCVMASGRRKFLLLQKKHFSQLKRGKFWRR